MAGKHRADKPSTGSSSYTPRHAKPAKPKGATTSALKTLSDYRNWA